MNQSDSLLRKRYKHKLSALVRSETHTWQARIAASDAMEAYHAKNFDMALKHLDKSLKVIPASTARTELQAQQIMILAACNRVEDIFSHSSQALLEWSTVGQPCDAGLSLIHSPLLILTMRGLAALMEGKISEFLTYEQDTIVSAAELCSYNECYIRSMFCFMRFIWLGLDRSGIDFFLELIECHHHLGKSHAILDQWMKALTYFVRSEVANLNNNPQLRDVCIEELIQIVENDKHMFLLAITSSAAVAAKELSCLQELIKIWEEDEHILPFGLNRVKALHSFYSGNKLILSCSDQF